MLKKTFRNRITGNHLQIQKPLRCRIGGMMGSIPTVRVAELVDLTLKGALLEHQGILQPESSCFLQLGINGDLSTIRCRVVNSRVRSDGPDRDQYHQTLVEFPYLTPAAEHMLNMLIQSLWEHVGWNGGGP